jgi:hypothetical protein
MKEKNMSKLLIKIKNPLKKRDMVAFELWNNPLYKQKVIKSKKIYNRKRLKSLKQIIWEK